MNERTDNRLHRSGVDKRDISSVDELENILEINMSELLNEENYQSFMNMLLEGISSLKNNNATETSIKHFLSLVSYNGNFSYMGDDIFDVFSGKSVSYEQIESLGLTPYSASYVVLLADDSQGSLNIYFYRFGKFDINFSKQEGGMFKFDGIEKS